MNKKILVLCEILFIIGASVFYIVKEVVPDLKKEFGSSDTLIKTDYYRNMFEIKIDNNINFGLIVNEDKQIYHLMFFDKNAACLYNQNIENSSIDKGLLEVIKLLIENDYLKSDSLIKLTHYESYYYGEFKKILTAVLEKYKLNVNLIENSSTLKEKSEELGLSSNGEDMEILRDMDYYSKEFTRGYSGESSKNTSDILNEENSKTFTNNVYRKIEDFVVNNKIAVLDKNNTELVITMLAADDENKYYPSGNSWYYVNGGKVYAYIEIIDKDKKFGYCYKGSIDLSTKGEC